MNYFANDSETRYVAIGNPNPTYYANQAAFPSATTYHGGVAHSHADGAMYYAHGGNWIKMAKDSDVTTNATNVATKLPLAGGTLTGDLTLSGAPTSNLHAATKGYVDTEVADLVSSAPSTLDTLNELAAALGDDANFSTTVTNSIATKMPLAGGNFTGDVNIAGDLGIGTTSAAMPLDVHGADTNANGTGDVKGQLRVFNDTTAFGSSPRAGIVFSTKYRTSPDIPLDGAAIYGGKENSSDADKDFFLAFATRDESPNEAVERMRITSSGSVGIGSTSPAANLEVSSTGTCSVNLVADSDNNGSANDAFIAFHTNSNSGTAKAALKYDESQTNFGIDTNGTRALSIDTSQQVGIGTTAPASSLHVSGSSNQALTIETTTVSADTRINFRNSNGTDAGGLLYKHNGNHLLFKGGGSGAERMRIDGSGRVLIGTTTEGQGNADNLTIADAGGCGLTIRSGTTSNGAIYFSDATSGGGEYDGYIEYNQGSQYMRFGTAQTEAVRIDSSGRLLIGTTTEGDSSADELTVENSTNAGITIRSGTTYYGSLYFSDATSGTGEYEGYVQYNHSSRLLTLGVASQTRLTINSSGNATFTGTVTAAGFNLSSLTALP
jgi:hypothetical protein